VSAVTMLCLRVGRHGSINSIDRAMAAKTKTKCGHHMTCALVGKSRELAAYNYTSSLAVWTTLE